LEISIKLTSKDGKRRENSAWARALSKNTSFDNNPVLQGWRNVSQSPRLRHWGNGRYYRHRKTLSISRYHPLQLFTGL